MDDQKKFNRKFILKIAAALLTLAPIGFIFPLVEKFRLSSLNRKKIELPDDLPEGITFLNEIIVNKTADNLKIFSSKCTHLGCMIKNRDSLGNIVCSCHGSIFSPEGKVLSGPASSDLKNLAWRRDIKSGKIIIDDISI